MGGRQGVCRQGLQAVVSRHTPHDDSRNEFSRGAQPEQAQKIKLSYRRAAIAMSASFASLCLAEITPAQPWADPHENGANLATSLGDKMELRPSTEALSWHAIPFVEWKSSRTARSRRTTTGRL